MIILGKSCFSFVYVGGKQCLILGILGGNTFFYAIGNEVDDSFDLENGLGKELLQYGTNYPECFLQMYSG